jgi:uncharacterized membrane protein YphA (DoxX/SURF4 family)
VQGSKYLAAAVQGTLGGFILVGLLTRPVAFILAGDMAGLNPYIEDVARRLGTQNYIACRRGVNPRRTRRVTSAAT